MDKIKTDKAYVGQVKTLTGTGAIAYGAKLSRVEVIPIYPITPQTEITEHLANFIADEELDAQYIHAESEHSAMTAAIGAASVGARTFTASSSQGLAYMNEMIHWAAGARLPIVMACGNRSLAPPWNLQTDHQDTISLRDTGWIQLYVENNQEALDTTIQAFRIAQEAELPVMVNFDGLELAYTYEPVQIPLQELVDEFLPEPPVSGLIDLANPRAYGAPQSPEYYMRNRILLAEAVEKAADIIERTSKEYARCLGRSYGGVIDVYKCGNADKIILTLGTIASTSRYVVAKLREKGRKIGLVKLRAFRPFPIDRLREVAKDIDTIVVIERDYSYGCGGVIADELKSKLYDLPNQPEVHSYIAGRGGKGVEVEHIMDMATRAAKDKEEWYINGG